jgi:TRAP-type C4-dicarboxylate transport system permease large subunit
MLFMVLIGARLFSCFFNLTSMPSDLQDWVLQFDMSPIVVILLICAIYIVLGSVLESMSMVLLTVPIFYPLVQHLGFDLIWFGIIVVVAAEISLITPPLGLNIFMIKNVMPDVPLGTIIRGVTPFVMMDILRLLLLVFVPWIVLVVPNSM